MWKKANANGVQTYTLPTASANTLGGVKVGTGLSIANGVLSTSSTTVPLADQLTGIYLYPETLNISIDSSNAITIKPVSGQVIYLYYLTKVVSFDFTPIGSITCGNNHGLRMNVSTGGFREGWDTQSNEIVLLQNTISTDGFSKGVSIGALAPFIKLNRNFDLPVITPRSYNALQLTNAQASMQSYAFINDSEMWVFDKDIDTSSIYRRDPNTFALIGSSIHHSLGYFNSCDYNSAIDAIVTGNGTGTANYTDNKATVYYNVSSWASMSSVDRTNTSWVDIDLNGLNATGNNDCKVQAMWGDSNLGKNNIIYIITNDGRNIRKLLLGQGSNNLGSGTFDSTATGTKFNGTYKIIDSWSQVDGAGHSQDCYLYNGAIYANSKESIDQHGLLVYKHQLCENGVIKKTKIYIPLYDDTGNSLAVGSGEGLTIHNGKLYVGLLAGASAPNYLFTFDVPF